MSNEKVPALLVSDDPYEERKPKHKYCSRSVILWVLAALMIALGLTLCVEFLYPVVQERNRLTDVEVVHIYEDKDKLIEVQEKTDTSEDRITSSPIVTQSPREDPWHLDFLINPTGLCDTKEVPHSEAYRKNPEIELLVLVQSPTAHFDEREAIRKAWGSIAEKPHGPTRLGFVLGTTSNATEEGMISKESEAHGDIIQADFQDSRQNVTTKSILMLKWVSNYCPHAQYVLKANDDTFVNLSVVTELLKRDPFAPDEKFIAGFLHQGSSKKPTPSNGARTTAFDEENYFDLYYDEKEYPAYASEASYVTTGSTASELFEASKLIKSLTSPINDLITRLCADKIAANLVHEPSFRYEELTNPPKLDILGSLATIHGVSPANMDQLWNMNPNIISDPFNFDSNKLFSDPLATLGNKPVSDFFDQWMKLSDKFLADDDWMESNFENWELPEDKIDKLNKPPKVETNIEIFGWVGDRANPGLQSRIQVGSGVWPFNQLGNNPSPRQGSKGPVTWQKSFVIPIPINRGLNNGFNITHLMGF